MSKYIFGSFMLIGTILILGTVGASDLDLISIKELALRGLIGIGLLTIGFRGLGGVERAKER